MQDLLVVLAGGPLAEARAADGVGALIAAWMARFVAAMARRASSSLVAAAAYSSAFVM
jgi:hypothetical protein